MKKFIPTPKKKDNTEKFIFGINESGH